jgi:hypothetical protein
LSVVCTAILIPEVRCYRLTARKLVRRLGNLTNQLGEEQVTEGHRQLNPMLLSGAGNSFSESLAEIVNVYLRLKGIAEVAAVQMLLYPKMRIHKRSEVEGELQYPVQNITMYSTPWYTGGGEEEGTERLVRERYDHFLVRDDSSFNCYKFIACLTITGWTTMSTSDCNPRSKILLPKPVILAQRLTLSVVDNTFYDAVRGYCVRSERFKFRKYTAIPGLVVLSMSKVQRTITLYEDFENPGSFYRVSVE